jgi:hypothetical protein
MRYPVSAAGALDRLPSILSFIDDEALLRVDVLVDSLAGRFNAVQTSPAIGDAEHLAGAGSAGMPACRDSAALPSHHGTGIGVGRERAPR